MSKNVPYLFEPTTHVYSDIENDLMLCNLDVIVDKMLSQFIIH